MSTETTLSETTEDSFQVLVSDGSEAATTPKWIMVDDHDCMICGVKWLRGDTINDAITRFIAEGDMPAGAVAMWAERMADPYPWQPPGYQFRWHVTALGGAS
jgi:hypothetical protein